jgi:hypothetical protein
MTLRKNGYPGSRKKWNHFSKSFENKDFAEDK